MTDENERSKEPLRERLTSEQYRVTQEAGTERPFTECHYGHDGSGMYRCACCGNALFESAAKCDSGTGWPSFWAPAAAEAVVSREDVRLGRAREEVSCATCDAHFGHVFRDGPQPTGLRFCINSAALDIEESDVD